MLFLFMGGKKRQNEEWFVNLPSDDDKGKGWGFEVVLKGEMFVECWSGDRFGEGNILLIWHRNI